MTPSIFMIGSYSPFLNYNNYSSEKRLSPVKISANTHPTENISMAYIEINWVLVRLLRYWTSYRSEYFSGAKVHFWIDDL